MEKEVWIGFVEVTPKNKSTTTILGRAKGGFSSILVYTDSKESFIQEVSEFANGYDLKLTDAYDIEPFNERLKKDDINPDLIQLAELALKEKNIQPGPLHMYKRM